MAHTTCHVLLKEWRAISQQPCWRIRHEQTFKHTWVVDVIEDGSASIEADGRTVAPIPAWMLPEGVKEGDACRRLMTSGMGTTRAHDYSPIVP
jgi:hypothetical protein